MSLLNQLRKNYPSLILIEEDKPIDEESYELFRTTEEEIVGIARDEINSRELDLLHIILKPYKEAGLSSKEKAWQNFLERKKEELRIKPLPDKVRFIFFSISDENIEREAFQEAMQALFPNTMPFIWKNHHEGAVIEEFTEEGQDPIAFGSIVDVLMSDFYTNIQLYISEDVYNLKEAPDQFAWAEKCFLLAKKYQSGKVTSLKEVVPYLYIDALCKEDRDQLKKSLLKDVSEDTELLQTIEVFLESGSNTTLAAKQLFMHRNSLQYRVDKFIEKTGVDIKQFDRAAIIYLLLAELNH
ncbi:PucR family transcriptional regulator [Halobacillus massiliensis]|uniref:PucR family transcriptional regulator n=1 Tax=Halobacillus massiliensis TaxID=1926286 RepID=UPI0009E59E4E|nr:helix-turn-helix domain-containing protein [Halobacillus massiliensis]